MKKALCMLMAALGIALGGTVVSVTPLYSHVEVAEAAPVAQSAPVVALAVSTAVAPTNLAGGLGIKPVWRYVSCYWAMDGAMYCWRYSCTYFERVALGCRDGWYRVTNWYA